MALAGSNATSAGLAIACGSRRIEQGNDPAQSHEPAGDRAIEKSWRRLASGNQIRHGPTVFF
jgi:hypothetical protein